MIEPVNGMLAAGAVRPVERCSFCARDQRQAKHLCAGPDSGRNRVSICDQCAAVGQRMVAEEAYSAVRLPCSFCGKSARGTGIAGDRRVRGVIAAGAQPGVTICDECVGLVAALFSQPTERRPL